MSPLRKCSRTTCDSPAVATMTYGYSDATAVLGPLSPTPDPSALDLCRDHANTVTVPRGWTLVRLADNFDPPEPSSSDLMALADAIRAASETDTPAPAAPQRDVVRPGGNLEMDRVRRIHPSTAMPRPKLSLVDDSALHDDNNSGE